METKKFKPLKADDIECRVSQINKDNSVNLLLYKTARTDMKYLDEVIGAENWQCDYKEVCGVVYCGIGIKTENGWIWKWDAGSESRVEAEKGQASDAFKRAGFRVGIGRELYTAPNIRIAAKDAGVKDGKCYTPFHVDSIKYSVGEIVELRIENARTGDIVYQYYKPQPNNARDKWKPDTNRKATNSQVNYINSLFKGKEKRLQELMEKYGVADIRDLSQESASALIDIVRKETGGKRA